MEWKLPSSLEKMLMKPEINRVKHYTINTFPVKLILLIRMAKNPGTKFVKGLYNQNVQMLDYKIN